MKSSGTRADEAAGFLWSTGQKWSDPYNSGESDIALPAPGVEASAELFAQPVATEVNRLTTELT